MILPTKGEEIRCFVKGLRTKLRIKTQSLVTIGLAFLDIVNDARTIETLCHEAYGVSNKWAHYEGSYSETQY